MRITSKVTLAAICVLGLGIAPAQTQLTNPDLVKLAKSGLSEEFITNLIDQQGSHLASDVSSLIELKNSGVSEPIIAAVTRKSPSPEKLNSDSILRLHQSGFTDSFITGLMSRQQGTYALDANRIAEMRKAGVSEAILSAMLKQSGTRELPAKTEISVRLIDAIDSERNNAGDEFRASLEDPIEAGGQIVAPKGADAKVRLASERESGRITGKAELTVELVSVTIDGKSVPVQSSSVSEYSGSRTARTAKTAGAVGAIGAIIGAIAGGGKGAAIGAGAGAAAGAGATAVMKGQRVRIPSETVLTFTLENPVTYR
jgi:hypothetical protein